MRKTVLLLGMALIASSAMMGQVVNRNMAAAITSENAELVLDSVVTKTREGKPSAKVVYGYDSEKRKAYEVSISYSEWSTPAYAPAYGDSIEYTYDQAGLLLKESTYRNNSYGGTPEYQLNSYIDYDYNAKGQLIKSTTYRYNDNIEAFVDNSINDYEYLEDGSLKTKIESARPAGAPWETGIKPMEKSSKTEYMEFAGIDLPKKAENYFYTAGTDGEEGTWRLSNYSVLTYNDKNLLAKREFYNQDYQSGDWKLYSWESYIYNDNGQVTYKESAGQDYSTGTIEVNAKVTYTYDANNNLEKITGETYQSYKNDWVPNNPITYFYSPFVPTSIHNTETSQKTDVYYNISAKEICVQTEGLISAVFIHSIAGLELIRVSGLNSNQYALNTSNWEAGLYIVTLIVDGKIYNEKIYIYE